eukprot:scaffold4264_cov116-Isochrysis_galbana.AAC.15
MVLMYESVHLSSCERSVSGRRDSAMWQVMRAKSHVRTASSPREAPVAAAPVQQVVAHRKTQQQARLADAGVTNQHKDEEVVVCSQGADG